jgi:hypothetical protein
MKKLIDRRTKKAVDNMTVVEDEKKILFKYLIFDKFKTIDEIKKLTNASSVRRLKYDWWIYVYKEFNYHSNLKKIYVYELSSDAVSMIIDLQETDGILERFYSDHNFDSHLDELRYFIRTYNDLSAAFYHLEILCPTHVGGNEKSYKMRDKLIDDFTKFKDLYLDKGYVTCSNQYKKILKNIW